jgi:hypothetical protein
MENKKLEEDVSLFEMGDFVKNKIHGYVSLLYRKQDYMFGALIVDASNASQWITDYVKEGCARLEIVNELEKVPPTQILITKAKNYLDILNSSTHNMLDNLSYIEILNKLNEQEKALQPK